MHFKDLNIIPSILEALEKENYVLPTPIQEQAILPLLSGRDLLGCAQTGTGKTAAFAVPILQLLSEEKQSKQINIKKTKRDIRALVLTPTRELALQIYESFRTYGQYTDLRYGVLFGGVSQKPQELMLQQGVDVLVATPGRINDLINQKFVDLTFVKIFVLDEADHMLDMGFIHDVKRIIAKIPIKKQTILFSATIPPEILKMANSILVDPVKITVTPEVAPMDIIKQQLYFVDKRNKLDLLLHVLKTESIDSALVFTRTKHGADRVVKDLLYEGIEAQAIHGNKSQNARQLALDNFKSRKIRVLVATDIAARGIDIDELSHVINFDLPDIPETYIHRVGRTGRAGLGGVAISFCDIDEKDYLISIEKLIGKQIPEVKEHPFPMQNMTPSPKKSTARRAPLAAKPMNTRPSNGKRSGQKYTGKAAEQVNNKGGMKKNYSRYRKG